MNLNLTEKMSTLTKEDHALLDKQIIMAKGQDISKEEVLIVFHRKLKEIDASNKFIIDQWDGAAVKELINSINKIKPVAKIHV